MTSDLRQHAARIAAWIERDPTPNDPLFESLALALFAFQFEHNRPYRTLCEQSNRSPDNVRRWPDIPAAPAAAFKELELTVLPPLERTAVFRSSGTTRQQRCRQFHNADSLRVYEQSLAAWAEPHLRLQADSVKQFTILTPPPAVAPDSSLVHMLATLQGTRDPKAFHGAVDADGAWTLNCSSLLGSLADATRTAQPVALFGTAFNFVHLLDALAEEGQRLVLPPGSRLMETGGYKGRSRALDKVELHRALTEVLGLAPEFIITEYGMCELSSQAYDATAGQAAPRVLRFPPWARVTLICPERGREVAEGESGLVRIHDLANVASVMAVQTEDLAVHRGGGFEWLGRVAASEPRGCSLMTA